MKFTKEEMAIMHNALLTTGETRNDGSIVPRQFLTNQQALAISTCDKIEKNIEDYNYVDGECEFGTEEKHLLLNVLDRGWSVPDARIKQNIVDKLK